MSRPWRFAPHDEALSRQLCGELSVSPLLAQVLLARGCETRADGERFLTADLSDLHDPDDLPGVADAAEIVIDAIKSQRPILIYGDYDVDGVTATSLLWHCIKLAGGTVEFYIPDRREEGYGLNAEAIRRIHDENPDRLVITVDCGICAVSQVALAKELGLGVVVTDHHTFGESIPEADAVIHPRLPGSDYPFGDLCGVGVAFKLAWSICRRLGDGKKATPRMREFLMAAVGLAGVGTVADVVPLIDENRIIVRYGLISLARKTSPGMKALFRLLDLDERDVLRSEDIGFKIAPRINAAGRLMQARLAVELLTTEDTARANLLASYLNQLNRDRQAVERRITRQAKEMVREHPEWEDMSGLVLADENWHPGVIGIVASRMAEQFQKPTVMIAMDRTSQIGQGSGRSFAGCDLHSALVACSDRLVSFGGHRAAAGLKIQSDELDGFRDEFHRYLADHDPPADQDQTLDIDAEVRLADVTLGAVQELQKLGPFGEGNPSPLFVATDIKLAEPPRRMGESQTHLTAKFAQHGIVMRAVAFGKGDWADELNSAAQPLSICFRPQINEFRGRRNVEMELIDWRANGDD